MCIKTNVKTNKKSDKSNSSKHMNKKSSTCDKAMTRADKRQIKLTATILQEKAIVDSIVEDLGHRLFDLDGIDMLPIDRDFATLRFSFLRAYSDLLFAMVHFETVRIRRSDGDFLNKDADYLMAYLFGPEYTKETRLGKTITKCQCGKACKCHKK